jgi:hypothetical protein
MDNLYEIGEKKKATKYNYFALRRSLKIPNLYHYSIQGYSLGGGIELTTIE